MICYDCFVEEQAKTDAIGVCHHCGVAVCESHGIIAADPVHVHELVAKEVTLPRKARELLCRTCWDALSQLQTRDLADLRLVATGGGSR